MQNTYMCQDEQCNILIIHSYKISTFSSYKSSVSKASKSAIPMALQARKKQEIFSICLKGILDVAIFGMLPGLIRLINLHNNVPSFRLAANPEENLSPVTASIHTITCFSAFLSYFSSCFLANSATFFGHNDTYRT